LATDSNTLTRTSLTHHVEVSHTPVATPVRMSTLRNTPVDVDLRALAGDVETPDSGLRFTLGSPNNGSVTLLADGHTARFTPAEDYGGGASFAYTVTDITPDPRTAFHYDFQGSDTTDVSGRERHGTLNIQGTGAATFSTDFPSTLAPHHTQSLLLTENGTAGAARVQRVIEAEDLNVASDDWTIAGWFKRGSPANMDVILQIGESGGFNPNALTLAFYTTSDTLQLRNYNVNTLDVDISTAGVSADEWHHYAIVRDGGTLSLYLNGMLIGSDNAFGFSFSPSTAIKFGAPSNTVVLDRWLNGSLADLIAFKGALDPIEIQTLGTLPAAYFAGLSATNIVTVDVAHFPVADAGNVNTTLNTPIDVDLRWLAADVETADADLHFTLGAATNGSVILLADGYTARFIPAEDYIGPAEFDFTVTDITRDERTLFNYDFHASDATDITGNGRHGTFNIRGTGTATYNADVPSVLAPRHTQSLRLTENGTEGAARVQRVIAAEDLDIVTDDWTVTGWFNRTTATNMDVIMQIGDSAGFGPNALTLAHFNNSSTLQLRNFDGSNTQDVDIGQPSVTTATWHHFAVVRDDSTLRLYLNGVLIGSDSSFDFSFSSATAIKFGGSANTAVPDRWLNGSLADVAAFKGVLDAGDIARLGRSPTLYSGGQSATNMVSVTITSALDSWRFAQFGTTENTGDAANDADWDRDGNTNFMEFAVGTNPKSSTTSQTSATKDGAVIGFIYQRSHESMGEVSHIVEWSDSLAPPWSSEDVTEEILSDNGTIQTIKARVPAGTTGGRFVRLRITR
jgi:hypothetical protein